MQVQTAFPILPQIYEQMSEKHHACLNVFYCKCSLYSQFTANISKKLFVDILINHFYY